MEQIRTLGDSKVVFHTCKNSLASFIYWPDKKTTAGGPYSKTASQICKNKEWHFPFFPQIKKAMSFLGQVELDNWLLPDHLSYSYREKRHTDFDCLFIIALMLLLKKTKNKKQKTIKRTQKNF